MLFENSARTSRNSGWRIFLKMAKTTTLKQYEILINHMEKNVDLAKGFLKKGEAKETSKRLWESIARELNANGPPIRDGDGWKKIWIDFKHNIKRKLKHNKLQITGTGGGPNKQHSFSPLEEAVIKLVDMHSAVNGIPNTQTFPTEDASFTSVPSASVAQVSEPSTSQAHQDERDDIPQEILQEQDQNTNFVFRRSVRERRENMAKKKYELLQDEFENQKKTLGNITKSLNSLAELQKENNKYIKKMYYLEEKKYKLKKEKFEEEKRESTERKIEKLKAHSDNLQMKKSRLNIETEKLLLAKGCGN